MALLREFASKLGSDVSVPEDADFSSLSNVWVWKPTADMKRVYAETRLLRRCISLLKEVVHAFHC